MDGDNVKAELDGLTFSIRDRVKANLHSVAGVTLLWQPQPAGVAGTSLNEVPCGKSGKSSYFIDFDLKQSSFDGRISLQVRALDQMEHSWVDGFGISWEGNLTNNQERLFKKVCLIQTYLEEEQAHLLSNSRILQLSLLQLN